MVQKKVGLPGSSKPFKAGLDGEQEVRNAGRLHAYDGTEDYTSAE